MALAGTSGDHPRFGHVAALRPLVDLNTWPGVVGVAR